MSNPFRFVDLFCGGGGSITGAVNALRKAGVAYEGRGFNHWDIAIRTIAANHPEIIPDFDRACTPIEAVIPDEIFEVDPSRIDLIWASPSCTQHSRASGGKKPKSNQLRCQPECILPYLRLTRCRRMFVENVTELLDWGPILDADITYKGKRYFRGQPDPRRKGTFFNLWYREVKASGYAVDMQVLNAADYGAATSRKRLIIQAVRKSSGERIVWAEPTRTRIPSTLFQDLPAWRPASDVIDWSISGQSIFDRRVPLCANTLQRIAAGIRKYWGAWTEPFLNALDGREDSHIVHLDKALPALWVDMSHTKTNGVLDTVDVPLNTICCSHGTHAVIQPLFVPQQKAGTVKGVDMPLSTIATAGAIGLVRPFLLKYYGNEEGGQDTDKPLDTITTKDRFGLVQGNILTLSDGKRYKLDITYRMLTVRELAAATGFPPGYVFVGGETAAKKMIGNAVCPDLAEALISAVLAA